MYGGVRVRCIPLAVAMVIFSRRDDAVEAQTVLLAVRRSHSVVNINVSKVPEGLHGYYGLDLRLSVIQVRVALDCLSSMTC